MKLTQQAYTAEFRELAVKRVKEVQSIIVVVKAFGFIDQTLRHWVKAAAQVKLNGAGSRVVTSGGNGAIPFTFRKRAEATAFHSGIAAPSLQLLDSWNRTQSQKRLIAYPPFGRRNTEGTSFQAWP